MKFLILVLVFSVTSSLHATEQQQQQNPCINAASSSNCQKYLNNINASSPCSADLVKFCIPKNKDQVKTARDIKFDKTIRGLTANALNECLNKNSKNLSGQCQAYLKKQSQAKCKEKLATNCLSLEGDKRIDCLANQQIKETDDCIQ